MANKTLCPQCRQPATVRINLKLFCSIECAVQWSKSQADKAKAKKQTESRRKDREKLKSLKTRSEWLKEAQAIFNKYIRLRDGGNPCISCGRHHQGQYHAGHYLSVGAHPELRFNEKNCNLQCQPCNTHLSGNLLNYRVALIHKIGLAEVERLEGPQPPLKLSIPEIQALIAEYKTKIKAISDPTTSTKNTC
jgi:hypothetical protein